MKLSLYDHCSGRARVPDHILQSVTLAAAAVDVRPEKGAAPRIRSRFMAALREDGWSKEIAVARGSDITISSMRDKIGLCFQTGNMARMYADLIKLQTLYLDDAIDAAIVVLPSQLLAVTIGSNIAQATRLERELEIYRKAYHVPTLVLGLE